MSAVVKEKAADLTNQATDFASSVKGKSEDAVDDLGDIHADLFDDLKQQSSDLSDRFRKAADEAQDVVEDTADDIVIDADEMKTGAKQTVSEGASELDVKAEDLKNSDSFEEIKEEIKEEVEKNNPEQ